MLRERCSLNDLQLSQELHASPSCVGVWQLMAFEKITIADIASGKFAATMISEIRPVPNTDQYACVSNDQTRIDLYSFKTGKQLERHQEQVRQYMSLLYDMGYQNISGYLWYIQNNNIVKVSL